MVSFCLFALMIYNTSEKKNQKQHPRMAVAWTMDGGGLEIKRRYSGKNANNMYIDQRDPPNTKPWKIKMIVADKSYEYDWTLNSRTLIEDVEEQDNQIEAPKYNIVPFTDLHSYKDSAERVDFLAVAIHIESTKEITTKFQQQTIQEIYLIDESFNPIKLTMWGRFVQDECKTITNMIEEYPIILGTQIVFRTYRGLSLSSRLSSTFTINSQIPEATALKQWANNNTLKIKSIIETSLTHPSTTILSIGLQKTVKICDIPCAMKALQSMEKKYFWIEAKINIIDSVQMYYYMSCATYHRKIRHKYNEIIVCENPNCKQRGTSTPHARAYVQLEDDTGKLDAVMFGEVVERTFGSSAVQLMENSTQEIPQHIEIVANKLATKKWTIKLSGDEEKMNNVKYKHFIILSIEAKQD
ncbi:replication protein A 70 kDa DNA-binding subunit B-like [Humulus lupulus]|uniref:replication protein A 70 kDa DNA-binding subunit B-like n=1 Tax=Humulus lupulus TaxID=3486 RepID=UPI002B41423E|nr:replication protein A 70 kDa DNA-binding subunit B-like [Humulus lupulus]